MATTVVGVPTTIATMDAYPEGKLVWIEATVSATAGDTFIEAAKIIDAAFGTSASGKIVQAFDGGNAALVLNGGATALSVCAKPNSGEGNITFRSALTGATNAAADTITELKLQCLVRF